MARFLHHSQSGFCNYKKHHLLAFFWCFGLLFGIWLFFSVDNNFLSLMCSVLSAPVSIVGLFFATCIPFLFSAIAVFFSGKMFLFPVALLKGISFSFVSLGIIASFGCSGWLIWLLICFTDLCCSPLLYWFWIRCLDDIRNSLFYDGILTASLLLLICSIDFCLIVPFWSDLIKL